MRRLQSCVYLCTLLLCRLATSQTLDLAAFQQRVAGAFRGDSTQFPSSVSLSGNTTWTAGALQESGTFSLQLSSNGSTAEIWVLPTLSHSLTHGPIDLATPGRSCVYTDGSGQQHSVFGSNCLQGMSWFFPSFVVQPAFASSLVVSDQTTADDVSQGLTRLTYTLPLQMLTFAAQIASQLQQGTTFSIVYSTATALPVRLVYQQASDSDESERVETDVEFSDYRPEAGFVVPHHLQRYVQRTLNADVTITNATIN